jgi:hypothetical protein
MCVSFPLLSPKNKRAQDGIILGFCENLNVVVNYIPFSCP